MIAYPYDKDDNWVKCSCCGALIENTPEHNVYLHEEDGSPYPGDAGYGMCVACGGDPTVELEDDPTEKSVRKKLGWAGECFFDSRIELLLSKLGEKNKKHFASLSYAKKVLLVTKAVEEGLII